MLNNTVPAAGQAMPAADMNRRRLLLGLPQLWPQLLQLVLRQMRWRQSAAVEERFTDKV